jgi:hypothetical protein
MPTHYLEIRWECQGVFANVYKNLAVSASPLLGAALAPLLGSFVKRAPRQRADLFEQLAQLKRLDEKGIGLGDDASGQRLELGTRN